MSFQTEKRKDDKEGWKGAQEAAMGGARWGMEDVYLFQYKSVLSSEKMKCLNQ